MNNQQRHPQVRTYTEEMIEQKKKDINIDNIIAEKYKVSPEVVRRKLDPLIVKFIQDFLDRQ